MAIAARTPATPIEQSSASSPTTVNFPAALAVGDVMVLKCATGGTASNTVSTPSGWNLIAQLAGTGNTAAPNAAAYIRTATAGDVATGSIAVTHGATLLSAIVLAYSGVNLTTPQDFTAVTFDQTTSQTGAGPATATVTVDGTVLIFLVSGVSTTATAAPPTQGGTWTELADRTVGSSRTWEVSHLLGAPPGTTGAVQATWSTSMKSVGILIGLRPAVLNPGAGMAAGASSTSGAGLTQQVGAGTTAGVSGSSGSGLQGLVGAGSSAAASSGAGAGMAAAVGAGLAAGGTGSSGAGVGAMVGAGAADGVSGASGGALALSGGAGHADGISAAIGAGGGTYRGAGMAAAQSGSIGAGLISTIGAGFAHAVSALFGAAKKFIAPRNLTVTSVEHQRTIAAVEHQWTLTATEHQATITAVDRS